MALSDEELSERRGISVELIRTLRQTRGTSNESLEFLPDGGLRRALRRLNYPDLARARHEHLLKQARGDDGRIPPNALERAFGQLVTMRTRRAQRPMVAGLPAAGRVIPTALMGAAGPLPPVGVAGLTTTGWKWLGPGNIGGRTRALAVHPADPQRMLAASAGGGVWFTLSGGTRWDPVDDFMANLSVTCFAVDPMDPNLVYAGTGEGFSNGDALRGGGIFRIVGGNSWQQIASTKSMSAVNRVAVTSDAAVLMAATPDGLMRSEDALRATWTKVLASPVADVKCHPKLAKRAVAGGLADGQAFFTTDGGKKWKAATHSGVWSGRVELVYAQKNPNIVYASIQGGGGELWRSSDGGKTYGKRDSLGADGKAAKFLGDQGWYGNVLWAGDPTNENLVLVGGVNIWRSVDGGNTLVEISTWWDDRSAHADHHAIVSHPGYDGVHNFTVFFGNDGGIFKAADIRELGTEPQPPFVKGWVELNNNYGVTQFFGGAVHAGSGRIVAGAQDNGTLCLDPGSDSEHWHGWFGGDGGFCAADPTDPRVFYGEYVYLNIHRNTDGCATSDTFGDRYVSGQFWNQATGQWAWKPIPFQIPDARTQDALFIAPFVLDVRNSQRLLAGGLSLWETTDAKASNTPTSGPRWRSIKTSTGSLISTVAISPTSSDIVWVGHQDGAVFRSVNGSGGAPSWQRCDHIGAKPLTPTRYCTRIVADATDPLIAYVTFGGFVSDNVWVTRDGGASWKAIGTTLPAAPVQALAVHPRRSQFLYIGTEVGVFGSQDGGVSWSPTNEGPANVSCNDLFWNGQILLCATHGRGMFRIDLNNV